MEEQSINEKRIRSLTNLYYSRPDIQKAIFEFSKNRETIPRYFEGFGKRPDSLQYKGDIFELVKKGATSFHCSEELWQDPLRLSTNMPSLELNELRIGWDLCLPDFETIFVRDQDKVKKTTLKQLSEELGLNSVGRFKIPKYLEILSINPKNCGIEYDSIKEIIIRKQKEGEKVLKISVENGKEIFVSGDHPIIIFANGGIKRKEAKNISNEDYVLTPLKINFPKSFKCIDIIDLINESKYNISYKIKYKKMDVSWILVEGENYSSKIPETIKNYLGKLGTPLNFYLSYEKSKKNRKKIKLRTRKSSLIISPLIKLNYSFGKLIGYYLSEGSIDKNRLEFVFNKNEVKEGKEVISLFNRIFGIKNYNKKSMVFHKTANSLKIRVNSRLLCFLFKDLLGFNCKADKKEIPSWLYNAPVEFISGLLDGYFIGDGSCIYEWNKKSIRIDAVSASKKLIEGLSVLCLKLGIDCNIIKHPKHNAIKISGEEGIKKFMYFCKDFMNKKKISFVPKKINHPSKHSMYPPFLDKNLIRLLDRNKQVNLYRAVRLNMRLNRKMALLAPNSNLKSVINSNLFPIKVKEVKELDYRGLFYDIETNKNHNFLQGDGIFTHNCVDIDSRYIDYSKIMAGLVFRVFKFHGIKNFSVKFSGSKGFHIIVPWKAFPKEVNNIKTSEMFPEWPRIITKYLTSTIEKDLIKEISDLAKPNKYIVDFEASKKVMPDLILVSPRHLFRAPYSLHEKTSLSSVVINPKSIKDFELKEADPLKVSVKDFLPEAKEGEAKELLMQALDWHKQIAPEKKERKEDFKPIKLEKISEAYFPPSIQQILKGVGDGRKRSLFVLLNLFRSIGMEKEEIEKRISEWNKKNKIQLKEGYIKSQLMWSYKNKIVPPPNYDKDYYNAIGIIPTPEELRAKNPVNYMVRKSFAENKINPFSNKKQKNKDNFKNSN